MTLDNEQKLNQDNPDNKYIIPLSKEDKLNFTISEKLPKKLLEELSAYFNVGSEELKSVLAKLKSSEKTEPILPSAAQVPNTPQIIKERREIVLDPLYAEKRQAGFVPFNPEDLYAPQVHRTDSTDVFQFHPHYPSLQSLSEDPEINQE